MTKSKPVVVFNKTVQIWMDPNRIASLEGLQETGWAVTQIVINDPDKSEDLARLCSNQKIALEVLGNRNMIDVWTTRPAGLFLSSGFPRLFKPDFVARLPLMVNIHPSLLPKYRGRSTIVWAIVAGDVECGLTAHLIDEGVDTGPILAQKRLPLSIFDTPRSLLRKLFSAEPLFIKDVLIDLSRGTLTPRPQPGRNEPLLPNRKPEHSRIDPNRPLRELYNTIRAGDPDRFPAHFILDGQKVCVRVWRPDKPGDEADMV
jgi:methionyl-tRNA formyltransferase